MSNVETDINSRGTHVLSLDEALQRLRQGAHLQAFDGQLKGQIIHNSERGIRIDQHKHNELTITLDEFINTRWVEVAPCHHCAGTGWTKV